MGKLPMVSLMLLFELNITCFASAMFEFICLSRRFFELDVAWQELYLSLIWVEQTVAWQALYLNFMWLGRRNI